MTIAALALVLASCSPQDPAPALIPVPESVYLEGAVEVDGVRTPYLLLPPAELVEGRRYPLVLFLHGAGERGDDNRNQQHHFPERMAKAENRAKYPCFVLAPQCPEGQAWTTFTDGFRALEPGAPATPAMRGAMAALREVVGTQPIDTDRIHLTGLSLGGFGTFDLAARRPDWFASATPLCGGGLVENAPDMAGLPFSIWHGADDPMVAVGQSQRMVEALRAAGAEVDYHELPGVGHDVWNQAYGSEGCLDWIFAQVRDPKAQLAAAARLFAEACAPDERVAFLGDSITEAGNAEEGYVDLLRRALAEHRPEAQVIPAGISGNRVPDLLARYRKDVVDEGATLVFVYIGINDVWHQEWGGGTSIEDFEAGLRELVDGLEQSGATVVLATPSVIGERRAGTNRHDGKLDDYAARTRLVAAERGLVLCDLARRFADELALHNLDDAAQGVLTSDEVHLNPAGNRLVAVAAARALRRAAAARD
ncbi:GDSL-type esterase/lipase family protein [Engelhardtia mirabilis]|uniref:Esterase n=1 Tax=Engelhardtia mirabilis TaxID=2528011 RepID=A0A518BNZ8_9BACT|nr:esterase [Planctomycetes bacterium Pla133]QDV03027.1 esterase [Planctomycetes bacterium Pla86]